MIKNKANNQLILYYFYSAFTSVSLTFSFISLLLKYKEIPIYQITFLLMIRQVFKIVFEVPTGFISDKYSKKISGFLGSLFMIIALTILFSNNIILLTLAFAIFGFAYTLITGSVETIYIDFVNKEDLDYIAARVKFITYGCSAVFLLFGGYIFEINKYYIVLFDIVLLICAIVVILFMKEEEHLKEKSRHIRFSEVVKYFRNKELLKLFYYMDLIIAFVFVGLGNIYTMILSEFGISSSKIGMIISGSLLLSAFFPLFLNKIKKYISVNFILIYFPIINFIVVLFMFFKGVNVIFFVFIYIVTMIMLGIYFPVRRKVKLVNTDERYRATAMSVQSICIAIGGILFFGMSSLLLKNFDIREIFFVFTIISIVLTTVVSYKLHNCLKHSYSTK